MLLTWFHSPDNHKFLFKNFYIKTSDSVDD